MNIPPVVRLQNHINSVCREAQRKPKPRLGFMLSRMCKAAHAALASAPQLNGRSLLQILEVVRAYARQTEAISKQTCRPRSPGWSFPIPSEQAAKSIPFYQHVVRALVAELLRRGIADPLKSTRRLAS